ncbi:carbohydrate ABC transporter permease [Streptomyces] [Streptomyces griseus]
MAKPGLISVGILQLPGAVGPGTYYPTVLNTDPEKRVLAQGLVELASSQGYKGDYSASSPAW